MPTSRRHSWYYTSNDNDYNWGWSRNIYAHYLWLFVFVLLYTNVCGLRIEFFTFCSIEYPLPGDVDPKAVYANNELNLDAIDVYGFDFDYTLIQYKGALHNLIYNLGRERLVNHKQVCGLYEGFFSALFIVLFH